MKSQGRSPAAGIPETPSCGLPGQGSGVHCEAELLSYFLKMFNV